jgi:hypothetical protein
VADERRPDLSAEQLAAAIEAVHSSQAAAFELASKKRASKCKLARRLLDLTADLDAPAEQRYAILHEAREWAIVGQDLGLAKDALEALAKGWRVDELELRQETVQRILPGLRSSAIDEVLSEGFDVLETLLATGQPDRAEALLEELRPAAHKLKAASSKTRFKGLADALGALGRGPKSRFGARREGRDDLPKKEALALDLALDWLVAHQSTDGAWRADRFTEQCKDANGAPCTSPGDGAFDVGITGLALLALLGEGSSLNVGKYTVAIQRGVGWLALQADPKSGQIGKRLSPKFLYCHAIATHVLCELLPSRPQLEPICKRALRFIYGSRNPYGAWRYDEPPMGLNNTSVTGWMVVALRAAEDAHLEIDRDAYEGALVWLDGVTDTDSGRVGYDEDPRAHVRYGKTKEPPRDSEPLTALGLFSRILAGQDNLRENPILEKHGQLMLGSLPEWNKDSSKANAYYWYYGTYAMYQLGGKYWRSWRKALVPALLESQRTTGHARGSWDPVGPSGPVGGRIYSTALMALCLEAPFRFPRLVTER